MKTWIITEIAQSAFRHGQGYAQGQIYRSSTRLHFKKPSWTGLPDFVVHMAIEDHKFLEKVYIHAFRQGLNTVVLSG